MVGFGNYTLPFIYGSDMNVFGMNLVRWEEIKEVIMYSAVKYILSCVCHLVYRGVSP